MTTATIILAAGASSRLGRPKQMLTFKGESLLKHTVTAAVEAAIGPVIVVIAANRPDIQKHIESEPVTIIHNHHHDEGIASSINAGITHVASAYRQCNNIILMVCDQPYVKKEILIDLVSTRATTGQPIVACAYNDTIGVPALFDQQFFAELLGLEGEEGGKKLLSTHHTQVAVVPFPDGSIDIDTSADYNSLLSSQATGAG